MKQRKLTAKKRKRWDYSLEGQACPACNGAGQIMEQEDAHRSAGMIPCPQRYFQGHGYPTCVNGKLQFSKYDRDNEKKLKKRFK